MSFIVVERFRDTTDGHIYEAGDDYPRPGVEVTAERIAELSGGAGEPMIVDVDAPCAACAIEAPDGEGIEIPSKAKKRLNAPVEAVRGGEERVGADLRVHTQFFRGEEL